uniref:Xylulose kinase-1 n=1 Tax=Tanacetum cinerariifolium TaxID=118510 RepID=A0A6L2LH67_TANCI|nr:xylulose kinase-1 [Tanacetum cinerariifolium]
MAPLTFADTHNMIAFLTKSDASKGFDQIVDFLNAHMIQYALMVNPTIYVSWIKQFWNSVSIKWSNDVMRLQALIDRKKVIVTEDTIRQALHLDDAVVDDLSSHNTKYTSPAITQKVFANMRRIEDEDDDNKVSNGPTPPLPTPATTPPPPQQEPILSPPQAESTQPSSPPQQQPSPTTDISMTVLNTLLKTWGITELDADEDVTLVDAKEDMNDTDEAEPAKVEEEIKVVTATKLMTEVVTTAATTITVVQVPKAITPWRRRGMTYNEIRPIFKKHYNLNQAFLERVEEEVTCQKEEGSKRKGVSLNQDAAKKQRINEEEEELKAHLQIVVNDDNDVFTEATPLASKVPVVDYQIHHENNKPYYKIIRADGTHKLFISFITLLKNFGREDLEMLWKLVQERFQSLEPNNFSDDFLLNTLKIMFEKPNVEARI